MTLTILWNSGHINIQGPVERKDEEFVVLAFLCPLCLTPCCCSPLEEEVETFKKNHTDLQRAMNENKDNEVTFAEFLEREAKMKFEDYIKCIRSSRNAPKHS